MKATNILIPTDFSLTSLKVIPALLQQQPAQQFNIVLVNFLGLSDSITDLLMLSRRSRERELITQEFMDECTKLSREYADQILCLQTEFFYGTTIAVFKNYLEAREITQIAKLNNYQIEKLTSLSYDPDLLLERSQYKVVSLAPVVQLNSAATKPGKVTVPHTLQDMELLEV